jgi:hypothetical protein
VESSVDQRMRIGFEDSRPSAGVDRQGGLGQPLGPLAIVFEDLESLQMMANTTST